MAEAAKDQDQSMEDILQSIKRIIAEEGEAVPDAAEADVLELTELLADDGSVSRVKADDKPKVGSLSIDEIMAAPLVSAPPPSPAAKPAPKPRPAPVVAAPPTVVEEPLEEEETAEELITGNTLSASVAALNALRDSLAKPPAPSGAMAFRSGTTVEDLVVESLKPMLKAWIDQNLPAMVEALVQKEIAKLTAR